MAEITDTADFQVGSETFKMWYKVVGDLKSGVRPLVTIHGASADHHCMLPHVKLSATHHIPVIFYDQLGIGRSTHLRDKPAGFFTVDLYVDELENLLEHLGIMDDFDLLGHSWGGMVASAYASERRPRGLKHLVLANAPASTELLDMGTQAVLKTLPEDVFAAIQKHQAAGTMEEKEYKDATHVFYKTHICCSDPWPEHLMQSFAAMAQDPTVFNTMSVLYYHIQFPFTDWSAVSTDVRFGPVEFKTTGTLKGWDITDKLPNINVPTLLINGVKDRIQDVAVLPFFQNIPKVKWVQTNVGTHVPFMEEKERYFSVLAGFLEAA